MASISVLMEGYVIDLEGGRIRASPSSVLIEDGETRVLVDPGSDREGLLLGLSREGLRPRDVEMLFVTHTHLDHLLNLRLFPEADVSDSSFIYREDEGIPTGRFIPGTEVEILPTPGHTPDHASLLVPVEGEVVLVAGDLFWWRRGAVQRTDPGSLWELEDEFASDPPALRGSRLEALQRADVVIPGHGKPFRLHRRPSSRL
ncbi:MAG: MBL fold metallo-hydrolase [Methanothrix sp.]|nr:MBL fold metallo-hydrolase [Methanothrix sp.]